MTDMITGKTDLQGNTILTEGNLPVVATGVAPNKTFTFSIATAESPGAMSALDRSRFVYDEPLTSVGAAVAGDVVRRVSAGVWAPANADTAAHCAGALGIYDGSAVNPIVGNTAKLNFVAAPTLMAPAYLSTTDGKSTNVVPSPIGISIYLGTPYVDTSVGAVFSAKVSNLVTADTQRNIPDRLLAYATSDLGGDKSDWDWFYDPFFGSLKINAGNSASSDPTFGQFTGTGVNTRVSCVRLESVANGMVYFIGGAAGMAANPASDKLYYATRVAHSAKGKSVCALSGNLVQGIGLWDSGSANANNFCVLRSTFSIWGAGAPTSGQVIDTGVPFDTAFHWFEIELLGDGTWRWRIDFATWSSPISDGATTGGFGPVWAWRTTTGTIDVDDIFYAVKRF